MSCDYGCTAENPSEFCANCGHPKNYHSTIHPHQCLGKYDKDRVHIVEQCMCTGYVKPKQ